MFIHYICESHMTVMMFISSFFLKLLQHPNVNIQVAMQMLREIRVFWSDRIRILIDDS